MSPLLLVLIKLGIAATPLFLLAWLPRVFPSGRLLIVALIPSCSAFGLFASSDLLWPLIVLDLFLAALVGFDLFSLPGRNAFSADRKAGRIASLIKSHAITLTLLNHAKRTYRVELREGMPHELNPEPAEFTLPIEGRSRVRFEYVLRPSRRGSFHITHVHLRIRSRWALWFRMIDLPCETVLHVYPDMKQLGQYALLARTNRLNLVGFRRTRRIGLDHDFERLRDYTVDDNYKHIEWRATARRRKLTVKDFQSSQSQRILFLVDCGRMMVNQAAGLSLLDHSLNAMLMLSYVALRQNDSVGMISFSNEVHGFMPPRHGMNQMNRLLHASFDRFPQMVESRYDQVFRYMATHVRKRSLVVLFTNVIDEVNAHQIERYLTNLVGRHLPLGVLMRDRRLFEAVDDEHPEGPALWRAAAAADILAWRHQVITDLSSKGALSIDAFPEEMTAPLVNRYLEIKARHLL